MAARKVPFDELYVPVPLAGCWIWTGSVNEAGYGRYRPVGRRKEFAHRFAYQRAGNDIPPGLMVCHRCDTPSCVNPAHLYLGTPGDNMRDRSERGRARNQNTCKTHCVRGHELTPDNVYPDKRGGRKCRACALESARSSYAARTAQ